MSFSGLESSFAAAKGDIRVANDALVLFIHWKLVQDGLLCIGSGNDQSRSGSELLPNGWSSDPTVYTLNYTDNTSNSYTLKVIVSDDSAICNLIRNKDNKTTDVTITTKQYIQEDLSSYSTAFTNKDELLRKVEQFVQSVIEKAAEPKSELEAIGQNLSEWGGMECNPLRAEPRRPRADAGPPSWDPTQEPPWVGGADLDPLGRGLGGGMLMDPFNPGRPMDPRWDPVGPRNPLGGPGPQFPGGRGGGGRGGRGRNFGDAMRPPGWDFDDNMYM